MNWKDLSPVKKIVLAFKENSQVSEFLINGLSRQNRSIRFGKPDCPVLDPGHVRPSSPDSSKDYRTYPASYQKSQFHAKSSQIGESLQIHLIFVII